MTQWVSFQHLVFSLSLTSSATDSSFWQVDDPAPSMSRSGRPFDLRPVSPISSIGYNAPTLAALMHRGAHFKKMTTKRSKASPSVVAATLAQAFKVKTLNYSNHADLSSYLHCLCIQLTKFMPYMRPIATNQCIGKNPRCPTIGCRCP